MNKEQITGVIKKAAKTHNGAIYMNFTNREMVMVGVDRKEFMVPPCGLCPVRFHTERGIKETVCLSDAGIAYYREPRESQVIEKGGFKDIFETIKELLDGKGEVVLMGNDDMLRAFPDDLVEPEIYNNDRNNGKRKYLANYMRVN